MNKTTKFSLSLTQALSNLRTTAVDAVDAQARVGKCYVRGVDDGSARTLATRSDQSLQNAALEFADAVNAEKAKPSETFWVSEPRRDACYPERLVCDIEWIGGKNHVPSEVGQAIRSGGPSPLYTVTIHEERFELAHGLSISPAYHRLPAHARVNYRGGYTSVDTRVGQDILARMA